MSASTHRSRPSAGRLADRLARRTLPRLVVAASRVSLPARVAARARRSAGRRARVELFFAFDDPCSAVAVIDLAARLASRPVELVPLPVVRRGIEGDPALASKRDYAITDAARLARRSAMTLVRRQPVPAQDTAFLAEWVAAAGHGAAELSFCVAAIRRLWFESDGTVERGPYLDLWRQHTGSEEPPVQDARRAWEARMARRGPYETPAVWVAGRWYFAHDRAEQICEWLDTLGWVAR